MIVVEGTNMGLEVCNERFAGVGRQGIKRKLNIVDSE
jgi:hypothetical protein